MEQFGLTEHNAALLLNVMDACGDRKLVGHRLRRVTRTNTPVGHFFIPFLNSEDAFDPLLFQGAALVKSGLAELEKVADLLTSLEVPRFEVKLKSVRGFFLSSLSTDTTNF